MKIATALACLVLVPGCSTAQYAWVNHSISQNGYAEHFHGDRGDCWAKAVQSVPLPQSYGPTQRLPSSYYGSSDNAGVNLADNLAKAQNDMQASQHAQEAADTRKQLFFDCMQGRGWSFEETKEEPKS